MGLQKYRDDEPGTKQKNGATPWYTRWTTSSKRKDKVRMLRKACQYVLVFFCKRHLVRVMQQNGFIIDKDATMKEIHRFFYKKYE